MKKTLLMRGSKMGFRLALCLLFTLMLCSVSVNAAGKKAPMCAKQVTIRFVTEQNGSRLVSQSIYMKNLSKNAVVTNVKSSNKKIQAGWNDWGKRIYLNLKYGERAESGYGFTTPVLRDGEKSTVSFKVKQNGKTYHIKCKVTFRKQTNPVKSIKIGNKTFKSFKKMTSGWRIDTNMKLTSPIEVKVTPKDGNKVFCVQANYAKEGWMKTAGKRFKNGAKIPNEYKGGTLYSIFVYYYDKASLQGIVSGADLIKNEENYNWEFASFLLNFK